MNTKIIDPVPVELLKAELTKSKKLEDTNKGHNELYIVTWHDSPNVVTEVGRLRELAFREAGGATGNAVDLDEYDKMEKPYKQLIVWDPENEAIIGGYRFLFGSDATFDENGQRDYESLMETVRVYENPYLRDKLDRGMAQVARGDVSVHDLIEADDD